ncbi:MAG: ATP-binding protein [Imperialibacter sp.]|uniref:ATP-binding protein n=1 Tax=Imperialibacter sp. TaxID=2038411 RepID=UPI003A85E06B
MDNQNITADFADQLKRKKETGEISEATLATSDRVLARITDGIYRQPSSALRELISNAYDADATEVVIQTDAPKFETITVRDNGNGMTREALANLIHNIGGSIKRTGVENGFGVVDKDDPTLSPRFKRKLIGKIGIGLFAVSQLTHHFQIITKRKGDDYRLFADIILKTYTEDNLTDIKNRSSKEPQKFETGKALVKTVIDPNLDSHGTDIVLLQLKSHSKDLLRSRDLWERVLSPDNENEEEPAHEPTFHIGKINLSDGTTIEKDAKLPWNFLDNNSGRRFEELVKSVVSQGLLNSSNPKLEDIFDNYFNTIWTLALSAPLPYVEIHPFDITKRDDIRAFLLSNAQKGQVKEIDLKNGKAIREAIALEAGTPAGNDFKVVFDDIELKRPILFKYLPQSDHAIKRPLIFIGKCSPDLSSIPENIRGGNLSFEAYLFWNSKIVPVEHRGVLLRVHNASGALFDETFLKYQVSEQTRLRQITAEIFVKEGLDAALNIDRESFNFAHPHYQFITKWLHRALRQFTNKHKAIGSEIRNQKRSDQIEVQKSRVASIAETQWLTQKKNDEETPAVEFVAKSEVDEQRAKGKKAYVIEKVIPEYVLKSKGQNRELREQKIQALVTVLDAFGLLDDMPFERQEKLIHSIADLFLGEDE